MKNHWDHCDICGAELVDVSKDYDNGALLESYERCPHGHYTYEFAYGNTRIAIGDAVWEFSYLESKDAAVNRQSAIAEAKVELRQKIWHELEQARKQNE